MEFLCIFISTNPEAMPMAEGGFFALQAIRDKNHEVVVT